MTTRVWRRLAIASVIAVTGSACGGDSSSEGAGPASIIATTSLWADVVANIACDGMADVRTLVPVGGDPHAYEPSLSDRGEMDDADLVVANGLLLEAALDDTLDAVVDAGTPVLRLAEHVDTISRPDGGGGEDPHVWFDPIHVAAVLSHLADRLVSDVGLDEVAVDACLTSYQSELASLDAEIAALVDAVPESRRRLLTSHDSLGYFADRYGFEIIGTVIPAPSTLAGTTPAQLEALAEVMEETGVRVIFAETQHSTDDVEALASRVGGVEVVTLFTGTLGESGSGADTYVGLLRTNAQRITAALG